MKRPHIVSAFGLAYTHNKVLELLSKRRKRLQIVYYYPFRPDTE